MGRYCSYQLPFCPDKMAELSQREGHHVRPKEEGWEFATEGGEEFQNIPKFCGRQISFLPRLRRMLKKARDISMTTMRAPCPRVGDSEKSEGKEGMITTLLELIRFVAIKGRDGHTTRSVLVYHLHKWVRNICTASNPPT